MTRTKKWRVLIARRLLDRLRSYLHSTTVLVWAILRGILPTRQRQQLRFGCILRLESRQSQILYDDEPITSTWEALNFVPDQVFIQLPTAKDTAFLVYINTGRHMSDTTTFGAEKEENVTNQIRCQLPFNIGGSLTQRGNCLLLVASW